MPVTIKIEHVERLFQRLKNFHLGPARTAVDEGMKDVEKNLKNNVLHARSYTGESLSLVTERTMNLPIKASGKYRDRRIRSSVKSSREPFNVTGNSLIAINRKRTGATSWEISLIPGRGKDVFKSNAFPERGNVRKPIRDPLGLRENQVSDKEMDLIEDQVIKALERAIR